MSHPSFDITNRVVVITGSGRGLGATLAEAFSDAGARVVIVDKDAALAEATSKRIIAQGGGPVIARRRL